MRTILPNTPPGQTARDCQTAADGLAAALAEVAAIAAAPIIEEARLERLRAHLGQANAACARLGHQWAEARRQYHPQTGGAA